MEKQTVKHAISDILRGLLIALLVNVVAVLLIAVVVKYTGVDQTVATIINQVVKVLSIAIGALVGFRSGRHGLLLGAILGTLYTVLGFATFSLLAGKSLFEGVTVFDFLIGVASGIFSGVLAVNVRGIERRGTKRKATKAA